MDWKWTGRGLEEWIGGELQVDWRWIRSGLEVDSVKRVMVLI